MEFKSDTEIITALRENGLQVTYQRLAIFQAVCGASRHPSAEEIHKEVSGRFPMISLGTVYKTLERFFDVGLVRKFNPITEVARYDAVTSAHHHIVCVKCGVIKDLRNLDLNGGIKVPDDCGFQVLQQEIILQGYCRSCLPVEPAGRI